MFIYILTCRWMKDRDGNKVKLYFVLLFCNLKEYMKQSYILKYSIKLSIPCWIPAIAYSYQNPNACGTLLSWHANLICREWYFRCRKPHHIPPAREHWWLTFQIVVCEDVFQMWHGHSPELVMRMIHVWILMKNY